MDHPLKEWADRNGRDRSWLCRRLGVSHALVSFWFSGQRRPSREKRLRIEKMTHGEITSIELDRWEPDEAS